MADANSLNTQRTTSISLTTLSNPSNPTDARLDPVQTSAKRFRGQKSGRAQQLLNWLAFTWPGNLTAFMGLALAVLGAAWAFYTVYIGVLATKWQVSDDALQACVALYVSSFGQDRRLDRANRDSASRLLLKVLQ